MREWEDCGNDDCHWKNMGSWVGKENLTLYNGYILGQLHF